MALEVVWVVMENSRALERLDGRISDIGAML
jgi:hypothetical protein